MKEPMSLFIYKLAQLWARVIIFFTGCHLTVIGRENIPHTGHLCFVSNHDSIFDIMLMLAFADRPFGFIAKKELAWIPFIDLWILFLGGLFIDRVNPRKALKTISIGINRIKAGGSMIIFPEGTRSRGRGLLPFRPGSIKLATQSEATIIPVALSGTYNVFEKEYRVQAFPVRVQFGEPIATAGIPVPERRQVLINRIQNVIAGMLSPP
ncbi:hypothetical protein FACS1894172_07610 [Spirochaetia bacterium]|nr:hypothetical protein FACS1894172_07610 [Spirochaetia bacterium]